MTGQLTQPGTVILELPPVAVPIPAVEQLVAALTAGTVGATCNFYAGVDAGAAVRRERLRRYLTARWAAPVVLVGEAPGYQGSRLSGIPFTAEHQLLGQGQKEPTATVVHRVLRALDAEANVLLWNAVPFHPHHPGRPRSNRRPTSGEVLACRAFLETVCAGRRVVAVGHVAAAAIRQVRTGAEEVAYVRHPSHGGARQFADGLARLLAVETGMAS
jgi:uracil-DNA glycosylase